MEKIYIYLCQTLYTFFFHVIFTFPNVKKKKKKTVIMTKVYEQEVDGLVHHVNFLSSNMMIRLVGKNNKIKI